MFGGLEYLSSKNEKGRDVDVFGGYGVSRRGIKNGMK